MTGDKPSQPSYDLMNSKLNRWWQMGDSSASIFPSHDVLTATLWVGAGAVAAALITARNAKLVKISEHRQNWINALRDNLSEYITKADEIRDRTADLQIESDTQRQALIRSEVAKKTGKANVLLRKILLRLNINEDDHIELAQLLESMQEVEEFKLQPGLPDLAVAQARRVLRREWAVAKYGMWADIILYLKQVRRSSWQWIRNAWVKARNRLFK